MNIDAQRKADAKRLAEIKRGMEVVARYRRREYVDSFLYRLRPVEHYPYRKDDVVSDMVDIELQDVDTGTVIAVEPAKDFPSEETVAKVVLWAQAHGVRGRSEEGLERDHTYREQMQQRYRQAVEWGK